MDFRFWCDSEATELAGTNQPASPDGAVVCLKNRGAQIGLAAKAIAPLPPEGLEGPVPRSGWTAHCGIRFEPEEFPRLADSHQGIETPRGIDLVIRLVQRKQLPVTELLAGRFEYNEAVE